MPKTVLSTFTSSTFSLDKIEAVTEGRNKKLKHLMQELQPHLDDAAEDLLQPRPKAVAALIARILKPGQ
jgi:hypothetical protein